jgi:NADPH:quinone reductase-like Zn-dependent oxidoreductase
MATKQPAPERPAISAPATMTAVVQDSYGEAEDVLRIEEIDRPVPTAGEVLLRVHAAGVDRGVWHLMAGLPYPVRLAGYGLRAPKDRVRGREVSGRVEDVGRGVTSLRVGDEVFGVGEGCFAEYARARADKLAHRSPNQTVTQAAATSVSALTALQGVRDRGRVQPGHQVLVIGASGGVGTFAVQIAVALGAEVTGVCRTSKVDVVRAAGAQHVLDHTFSDITDAGHRYDVVIDVGGHRSLTHLRRAMTPHGTLVIVGSETAGQWLGGFDRSLRAPLLSSVIGQDLVPLMISENAADLIWLRDLVDAGSVTPVIDRTYPLDETPAAIRHVSDGHARGKVVVAM